MTDETSTFKTKMGDFNITNVVVIAVITAISNGVTHCSASPNDQLNQKVSAIADDVSKIKDIQRDINQRLNQEVQSLSNENQLRKIEIAGIKAGNK